MAQQQYGPEPFRRLLLELLGRTGETYRRASRAAGLRGNAISRFMEGARPSKHDCVALADHFGVNPNDLLQAAGIEDPKRRERVLRAMEAIVDTYLNKIEKKKK